MRVAIISFLLMIALPVLARPSGNNVGNREWLMLLIVLPIAVLSLTIGLRSERKRREAWRKIAKEMRGEFIKGGFRAMDRVRAKIGEWPIVLYMHRTGPENENIVTCMRAPYVKKDDFRFSITHGHGETEWQIIPKMRSGKLQKLREIQEYRIGYPGLGRNFIIRGNNESKVQALLANYEICRLIRLHLPGNAKFEIANNALCIDAPGKITDIRQLRGLFELFAETLAQLCHIGSAYEGIPGQRSS